MNFSPIEETALPDFGIVMAGSGVEDVGVVPLLEIDALWVPCVPAATV